MQRDAHPGLGICRLMHQVLATQLALPPYLTCPTPRLGTQLHDMIAFFRAISITSRRDCTLAHHALTQLRCVASPSNASRPMWHRSTASERCITLQALTSKVDRHLHEANGEAASAAAQGPPQHRVQAPSGFTSTLPQRNSAARRAAASRVLVPTRLLLELREAMVYAGWDVQGVPLSCPTSNAQAGQTDAVSDAGPLLRQLLRTARPRHTHAHKHGHAPPAVHISAGVADRLVALVDAAPLRTLRSSAAQRLLEGVQDVTQQCSTSYWLHVRRCSTLSVPAAVSGLATYGRLVHAGAAKPDHVLVDTLTAAVLRNQSGKRPGMLALQRAARGVQGCLGSKAVWAAERQLEWSHALSEAIRCDVAKADDLLKAMATLRHVPAVVSRDVQISLRDAADRLAASIPPKLQASMVHLLWQHRVILKLRARQKLWRCMQQTHGEWLLDCAMGSTLTCAFALRIPMQAHDLAPAVLNALPQLLQDNDVNNVVSVVSVVLRCGAQSQLQPAALSELLAALDVALPGATCWHRIAQLCVHSAAPIELLEGLPAKALAALERAVPHLSVSQVWATIADLRPQAQEQLGEHALGVLLAAAERSEGNADAAQIGGALAAVARAAPERCPSLFATATSAVPLMKSHSVASACNALNYAPPSSASAALQRALDHAIVRVAPLANTVSVIAMLGATSRWPQPVSPKAMAALSQGTARVLRTEKGQLFPDVLEAFAATGAPIPRFVRSAACEGHMRIDEKQFNPQEFAKLAYNLPKIVQDPFPLSHAAQTNLLLGLHGRLQQLTPTNLWRALSGLAASGWNQAKRESYS